MLKINRSSLKEFVRYTSLNVLGMIGMSAYILADTYFISKGLGANGLTALNLAIPIYSFIHGSGLMLGIGGATKFSIFKAQKELHKADSVFSNTVCLAGVLSIIFILTSILFSEKIALLFGANREVYDMTELYMRVIMLFSPAFIMNNVLICFVRNDGNPRLSMLAVLIGCLSNIILDYIFIFPMNMGILGAVLATGFAPSIGICILSRHFISKKNTFHFKRFKPSLSLTAHTLSLGLPSLILEAASGIVIIAFNYVILKIQGNTGVAAYGVIANLSMVVMSIYTGIGEGMQPLMSRAYGVNNFLDIKRTLRYGVITIAFISLAIYSIIFVFASPIADIFNNDKNITLQQIAETGLKLYFLAIPFAGFNIVLSIFFTSIEKAIPAQIISLLRGFFLIIPTVFLMSLLFKMTGVWLSFPITELVVSLFGIILYKRYKK